MNRYSRRCIYKATAQIDEALYGTAAAVHKAPKGQHWDPDTTLWIRLGNTKSSRGMFEVPPTHPGHCGGISITSKPLLGHHHTQAATTKISATFLHYICIYCPADILRHLQSACLAKEIPFCFVFFPFISLYIYISISPYQGVKNNLIVKDTWRKGIEQNEHITPSRNQSPQWGRHPWDYKETDTTARNERNEPL